MVSEHESILARLGITVVVRGFRQVLRAIRGDGHIVFQANAAERRIVQPRLHRTDVPHAELHGIAGHEERLRLVITKAEPVPGEMDHVLLEARLDENRGGAFMRNAGLDARPDGGQRRPSGPLSPRRKPPVEVTVGLPATLTPRHVGPETIDAHRQFQHGDLAGPQPASPVVTTGRHARWALGPLEICG